MGVSGSLPPPRPRSPPEYPDLYGRRREAARVQMLEREIWFLEEELKYVESLQPASELCKEFVDLVLPNADPLIPSNEKNRRSCRFLKWFCGSSCFSCHTKRYYCSDCCSRCLDCGPPNCKCCSFPSSIWFETLSCRFPCRRNGSRCCDSSCKLFFPKCRFCCSCEKIRCNPFAWACCLCF